MLLWDELSDVIFRLLLGRLKDDMLIVDLLDIGFEINEVVLLGLDKRCRLLRLLLQFVLSLHQIPLQLVQARIMHIAHLHLGEGGQLAHIFSVSAGILLEEREARLLVRLVLAGRHQLDI